MNQEHYNKIKYGYLKQMDNFDSYENSSEDAIAIPEILFNDREVVEEAICCYGGQIIKSASPELRANKELVLQFDTKIGTIFPYLSEELKNDKEIVLKALMKDGTNLCFVSENLRDDNQVVETAMYCEKSSSNVSVNNLYFASDRIKNNKDIVKKAMKTEGFTLNVVGESLKSDIEIVKAMMHKNPLNIQFAAPHL